MQRCKQPRRVLKRTPRALLEQRGGLSTPAIPLPTATHGKPHTEAGALFSSRYSDGGTALKTGAPFGYRSKYCGLHFFAGKPKGRIRFGMPAAAQLLKRCFRFSFKLRDTPFGKRQIQAPAERDHGTGACPASRSVTLCGSSGR